MKTDVKAYKIVVANTSSTATLICVTYKIGFIGNNYGAEFYELISSFDNSEFRIPDGSHTFSFQEELRIFATSTGIAPENRLNIENWIEDRMKEAYGAECNVQVTDFVKK